MPDKLSPSEIKKELVRRKALKEFKTYFRLFPPKVDYLWGRHTYGIIKAIQEGIEKVERGESVYLNINIPFRHGKSDIVSRRAPGWILNKHPEWEVMLVSYAMELASDMSYESRNHYGEVGPIFGNTIAADMAARGKWKTSSGGGMYAAGLEGSITGKGAKVLIVDDYCKNRLDAESPTKRQKAWDSLTSDVMTRVDPVSMVVIMATRWGTDDISGRVINRNDPTHEDYDEDFPIFEHLVFGMESEHGANDWLFPERFSESWYKSQRAALGTYAYSSLGLQNPTQRTGNMLRADLVVELEPEEWEKMTAGVPFIRGWDIASSEKQTQKDDPDYTVGTKAAFHKGSVFVADVQRGRWSTLKRDRVIKATAEADGITVPVHVEAVAGYVDTFRRIKDDLSKIAKVKKVTPDGDKVSRAANSIEAIFELGLVYVPKGAPWLKEWYSEYKLFPKVKHDDQVDSLLVAIYEKIVKNNRVVFST